MAEGRDLVKEAIEDAKSLKEAAMETAKQQLVENLAPAVRKLLDESFKSALGETRGVRKINGHVMSGEQRAQSRNPADPDRTDEVVEPENESAALDLESALQEFFPAEGEHTTKESKKMADMKKSSAKSSKNEVAAPASSKSSVACEEIEISEAELQKVYESAIQCEVQVKKGFSDIVGGGELEDAAKETGIADKKAGESHFADNVPPHKQDFTVKEMLQRGLAENKSLRENLRKAVSMIETLGKKLHEVNLFNAKVLHVNKVLNSMRLTKEQKTYVMESIDKARSISEVKMVFETIVGGLKSQNSLQESKVVRTPKADAQRVRTTGTPKQDVLSESVDRANGNDQIDRLRQLAGIVNGKR